MGAPEVIQEGIPKAMEESSAKMGRTLRALHERRITPETAAKMKQAHKLMQEHRFKEASAAWDEIYLAGEVFEGYDFYSEGRALGCEPDEKEDSFRSVCRSLPPVPLREGDIVQLWAGITVRVEKTEKLVLGDTPYLVVQGQTHQSRRDQLLTAPWLGG